MIRIKQKSQKLTEKMKRKKTNFLCLINTKGGIYRRKKRSYKNFDKIEWVGFISLNEKEIL